MKKQEAGEKTGKPQKKQAKKVARFCIEGRIYINASFNNTLITVTDNKGDVLGWTSSGKLNFKGTRKSTPHAATLTMEEAINISKKFGMKKVEVFVRGPGPGRDSALKTLASKRDLDIGLISDVTPIPHNGPRPPKRRRI